MLGNQKPKSAGRVLLIPQEQILPNPNQPRQFFDYVALEELAASIRENGLLSPINIRRLDDGKYELISGERRLRACRMIGLSEIPSLIMTIPPESSAVYSLVENLQREDLSFFEQAKAIEKLMFTYGISQEHTAKMLGKSQSALSNKLRILRLSEAQRAKIIAYGLTERHARALLSLDTEEKIDRALSIICDRHLNVEESDRLIRQINNKNSINKKIPIKLFKDVRIFINTLNHAVDTMRRSGIEADTAQSETDEYIEYVVRIPKPDDMTLKITTSA